MGDRIFDPEATREVGSSVVPKIAQEYQRFSSLAVQAGAELQGSGISTVVGDIFIDYHMLLRNATAETFENLVRLGPALMQIAADDELADDEIASSMEALAEEVEGTWTAAGYTPLDEVDEDGELRPAPGNFEAALGGESTAEDE